MPCYGKNFQDYFEFSSYKLHPISIYSLGTHLIDILEKVHRAGFVYNDLKLDNIMLALNYKDYFNEDKCFKNEIINLIDFGFASSYIDIQTGHFLQKKTISKFRGNLLFAS